jgi:hypothetical protein
MPAAPTLECRLLSACNCAYAINEKGVFTPPAPYFETAGFTATPTVLAGGPDNINAGLVAASGDGVVIAFRGTLPPSIEDLESLLDWAEDFEAAMISVAGMPGKVHSGFWRGLDTIWDGVLAAVHTILAASGEQPLHITGHSKGGGFAHLAAMRLKTAAITPAEVCTFAAPRVGDADFAAAYDQAISAFRYEYTDDIVPHLPPDLAFVTALEHLPFLGQQFESLPIFDYADVGTLRFIDWKNQVVGDSNSLKARRILHLATLIAEANFGQIAADHQAGCEGGYMTQVCPGVCPIAGANVTN